MLISDYYIVKILNCLIDNSVFDEDKSIVLIILNYEKKTYKLNNSTHFVIVGEVLLPELNGNVTTSKILPLPPINYKEVNDDLEIEKETWCVDFPTSGWSQFCTLWKRMTLQLYRNKV